MNEEPTITLNLTPKQASLIYAMSLTYSWTKGNRGEEVRKIFDMLCPRVFSFGKHHVVSFSQFGQIKGNESLWFDDDPENTSLSGDGSGDI